MSHTTIYAVMVLVCFLFSCYWWWWAILSSFHMKFTIALGDRGLVRQKTTNIWEPCQRKSRYDWRSIEKLSGVKAPMFPLFSEWLVKKLTKWQNWPYWLLVCNGDTLSFPYQLAPNISNVINCFTLQHKLSYYDQTNKHVKKWNTNNSKWMH